MALLSLSDNYTILPIISLICKNHSYQYTVFIFMKPQPLKVTVQPEHSFSVRHDVVPYFYNQWHYHEEYELVYILKGSGRQFIGDNIHHFKSGDMLFVGSNIPHLWRSDKKFFRANNKIKSEAYVIHFRGDCLGLDFFNLPENKAISNLLSKAKQGIRINEKTKSTIIQLFEKILQSTAAETIIFLLEILNCIANSKDLRTICRKGVEFHFNASDSEKLNNIYQYINQNFSKEIKLKDIAAIAYLSPTAFCRYFKSRVKKSFSKFLIEIRIGHACKLLAETNKSIIDICYDCGYNNFSNFYRHFKYITRKTPLQYKKYYLEV